VYQWWVFVHIAGVFGLLVSHGVSIAVTFRLRAERDPARAVTLLEISSSTITAFYVSLAVLLLGGIAAAFDGGWWGYGWIWASLATLAAHTTSPRGSGFEVVSSVRFLKAGAFDAQNLVTVPHAKLVRKLGVLSPEQLSDVEVAVRRWLGI
jgi:hypothetical protein